MAKTPRSAAAPASAGEAGFTLIQLLACLVLLTALTAIVLPRFAAQRAPTLEEHAQGVADNLARMRAAALGTGRAPFAGQRDGALSVAHAILDWHDPAGTRRQAGATADDYARAGRIGRPRHGPFCHVAELRSVLGMDQEFYALVADAVTVHHGLVEPNGQPLPPFVWAAVDHRSARRYLAPIPARNRKTWASLAGGAASSPISSRPARVACRATISWSPSMMAILSSSSPAVAAGSRNNVENRNVEQNLRTTARKSAKAAAG